MSTRSTGTIPAAAVGGVGSPAPGWRPSRRSPRGGWLGAAHAAATATLAVTAAAWVGGAALLALLLAGEVAPGVDPTRARQFLAVLFAAATEQAAFFAALVWGVRRLLRVVAAAVRPASVRPGGGEAAGGPGPGGVAVAPVTAAPVVRAVARSVRWLGAVALAWPLTDFALGMVAGPALRARFGSGPFAALFPPPVGGPVADALLRTGTGVNVPLLLVGVALLATAATAGWAAARLEALTAELEGVV